jgi:hypothetical protein
MNSHIDGAVHPKVYTTEDGRVVIEQSEDSIVLLSADQIPAIIKELHVCYDYCAAWKESSDTSELTDTH